ncbi:MAG TPA: sulfurtransferase [Candidatus Tenderia electrophaga]|uniref:Sulfurtransferase n=1 Tax=Candidatus Tenderia electrophaga TaxID=1748243 RepID=A0A832N5B0_9GAMM|nr:sulfurtransferase [Candidatus Tenderia electrophaga]
MSKPSLPLILEPEQLVPLLDSKNLLIIDLSDLKTHRCYHVPGALHLSYNQLCQELPNSVGDIPNNAPLSQTLNQIGLTAKHHVIAYDNGDNAQACRLLWTLDLIGHNQYSLLNGGLSAWLDEDHPNETGINKTHTGTETFSYQTDAPSVDLLYLLQHLNDKNIQIIDARSPEEFSGQENRAQRGGHIPKAINLDHRRLISPEHSMRLKPKNELSKIIKEIKLKPKAETICYCHTHRRSALVYIALKSLGFSNLKAYPGSWAEWGNNLDTPIE